MHWTLTARVLRIACLVLTMALAQRTAFAEQRYAIVIGSNPGWSQDRPLRYAENDAERVRDVLISLGGFAPDRVELLRDPTTADVRNSLRRLAQTAHDSTNEETLVFVYYSGHADDTNLHIRGEPLSFRELQDTMRSLPATIKLAVIDACKSGAVTRKGGSPVDEFDVSVVNPKLSGMVFLTSSGADELSQESRALAGSVFTHHLVSGMRGAADEDGDHQVTISEAYHYAFGRTRADTAISGAPQRPGFRYELSGQGELVLTHLTTAHFASMTVPKGADQKYVVLDSHEWRLIAEAHAQKDRDVVLALAPGNYRIKRVLADHLEVGSLALAAGDHTSTDKIHYDDAPLSTGVLKGDPSNLTPEERNEWSRTQAFGLLASGQAAAALAIFDRLLNLNPGDLDSWRGRGRALVRLAEAYERVSDTNNERRTLGDALRADPSLGDDPLFQIWYKRLGELDARDQIIKKDKIQIEHDLVTNPRTYKKYGVGFDLFSPSGMFTVNASLVVKRILFPRLAFDVAGPGFDASIGIAPMPTRWSPYLALGGHMSLKKLGWDTGGTTMVQVNMDSVNTDDMWGATARIEGGAQYVSGVGFTCELGLAMLVYADSMTNKVREAAWPSFHFGWLW